MVYFPEQGEVVTRSFSGGWKLQSRKGTDLLKPNPNRDDVEKKAWNFYVVKNHFYHHMLYDAQIYKCIDIRRNLTNLSVFEEAYLIFFYVRLQCQNLFKVLKNAGYYR